MLTYKPSDGDVSPRWTIASKGIEELVSQDVIIPKGSHDRIYVGVADATGMVLSNPEGFTATQIPLQTDLISQGSQLASCPGDPDTVVVSTSNVYNRGPNQSGISFDAGKTWTKFASAPKMGNADVPAGSLAISKRGSWARGQNHLVQLPCNNCVPLYSKDGGKTWAATKSFPVGPDGMTFKDAQGFWLFALKQRQLYADPFVPDRFYLKLVGSPDGLYCSNDGGETWNGIHQNGLPQGTHHGQLAVNDAVQNDLWFADGWEGATAHGLFHSPDGGKTFQQCPGISHAITLALGAGSGKSGDQPYSVYFYGQLTNDPKWGVFRSCDGGKSWARVAYYPAGIFDQPTCMAASWDTFGLVVIGFSGNSYVYGREEGS